ncbi:hypothetical protein GCM10025788_18120 [Serinicoccus chungangensis]
MPGWATAYPERVDAARLDPELLAWTAGAIAVLALLVTAVVWRRLRVVDRRLTQLVEAGAPTTPERERIEALEQELEGVRGDLAQALRHVAVVRYDAFGDMGGRMSFSAAVVDDTGDGMVISSIHARGESRTYAKGIVGGDSEIVLTPEERQALDAARTGQDT